ncbi:MAG TPA: glycosyltransferase [Gammaproteobacteria bacterium]|nr:glycosyltransferase [Gammaproteobacteria bacterium]
MKLGIIYSDRRGKFVAKGFEEYCDVVEIDLSDFEIHGWQRRISALVSFRPDKKLWKNDFYRNPVAVLFRKRWGEKQMKKVSEKVDAVLQFGLMNIYDYSLLGQPKVFYYVDGAYDPNNPYWYSPRFGKWFSGMQRMAYADARCIFTFSKWAQKQHVSQLGISEAKVINVGWGPCLHVGKTRRKHQFNDPPHFLFIGRNSPTKGFDVLAAAFAKVHELYSDVILHCVGIGDGEYSDRATDGIDFHGYCTGKKLEKIIRESDVFILPSLYDRASHSTVEAICHGLVPIVTDTCGASEPVFSGQCGIVVQPGDPDSLADAMVSLVEDQTKLLEFSDKAFEEAQRNWTWKVVCKRMIKHMELAL